MFNRGVRSARLVGIIYHAGSAVNVRKMVFTFMRVQGGAIGFQQNIWKRPQFIFQILFSLVWLQNQCQTLGEGCKTIFLPLSKYWGGGGIAPSRPHSSYVLVQQDLYDWCQLFKSMNVCSCPVAPFFDLRSRHSLAWAFNHDIPNLVMVQYGYINTMHIVWKLYFCEQWNVLHITFDLCYIIIIIVIMHLLNDIPNMTIGNKS